uniref:RluA family pseudouridine synthase n=1 Tax=Thaumasiovibrio occultus TaxID=1891184 RepID=UPI000B3554BB|nr:RluA family pseudouridine synthase [Thaumasiovibrio occultus]
MSNSVSSEIVDNFVAPECLAEVEILYQDDDILLINKPSGLLSLSGKNPLNWDSVHYRLVRGQCTNATGRADSPNSVSTNETNEAAENKEATGAFENAKLPHRLDLWTSGIMVVALNSAASTSLNKQFQARTVQKRYLAMLAGWVEADSGQISAPIAKDKALFPRVKICHTEGKNAVSHYQVIRRLDNPKRTLVQYTPITGRTHQLRIHSLEFGHPILGCDLYNTAESINLAAQCNAQHLMLHASEIQFTHPATGQAFHGSSPCVF